MGLLDDAIREHLDLKRRRGADPAEVERAEREALGPVRRAHADTAEAEPGIDEEEGYEDDRALPAYDHEGDEELADPFEEHDQLSARPNGERPPPAPEEPTALHEAPVEPPFESPRRGSLEPDPDDDPFAEREDVERLAPEEDLDSLEPDREPEPHAAAPASPAPHPAPASPAPPREPSDHLAQETAEYHVEDALDQEGKDREDVLEETPEFLQDTPEHDRLWFEQRPPRDFDFDG